MRKTIRLVAALAAIVALLAGFPVAAGAGPVPAGKYGTGHGSSPSQGGFSAAEIINDTENNNDLGPSQWVSLFTENGAPVINGTVGALGDPDDVYVVWLYAGESISASLNSAAGQPLGLNLYDEYSDDLATGTKIASAGPSASFPMGFSYTADESGYFFFDVRAAGTQAAYTLDLNVTRRNTSIAFWPGKTTVAYAGTTTLYGELWSDYLDEAAPSTGEVMISFSTDGKFFEPMKIVPVVNGQFSYTPWPMGQKIWFQATFLGNGTFCPSPTASTAVNVQADLGPVAGTRYSTRSYKLEGFMAPRHTPGSYPVRIYMWRYVNGSYKAYGYKNARAYDYKYEGETYTRYYYAYKFPYTGKWRLQAYHADSLHAATRSSYSYLTVK